MLNMRLFNSNFMLADSKVEFNNNLINLNIHAQADSE